MSIIFFKKNRVVSALTFFCLTMLVTSCATKKTKLGKFTENETISYHKSQIKHQFFLLGDAGDLSSPLAQNNLLLIRQQFDRDIESTFLFLGDNIYPKGFADTTQTPVSLQKQIDLAKKFHGNAYFLSGNHDWYSGYQGLKNQVEYINKNYKEKSFYPKKGCGIDDIKVTDKLVVITIDSQWYLTNWDKHPNINDECSIKSREDFFEEFDSLINKYQNQTVIVAMHHPMFSNAEHGGKYSVKDHLFPYKNIPLPILGTFINYVRKTSGILDQDLQNKKYISLRNRLITATQNRNNVVFVSGHDHTLQYIEREGVKQIISGAGSYADASHTKDYISFASGKIGFAVLDVLKNGETWVKFYASESGSRVIFSKKVLDKLPDFEQNIPPVTSETTVASIYTKEMTTKSAPYKFLWGEHYRDFYSTPIEFKNLFLDKVKLTPTVSGGGNQTMSLRLLSDDGREFAMRAIKKSAPRFVQKAFLKDKNVEEKVKGTYAESLIYDFYTTSHPYTPIIINNFSDAIGIHHTNPQLYFVPKQNALGYYNEEYGDAVYLIEERVNKTQLNVSSFGNPTNIISTPDLMENLRKDEKYIVDKELYLKSRLFDFLIGDWDRHGDQWRWAEFKTEDAVLYQPIPRDRDQAFAKIDGVILAVLRNTPPMRHMQSYKKSFAHPRWINKTAFSMDVKFLTELSEEKWVETAEYIKKHITNELIDQAFDQLPAEVNNSTSGEIKEVMRHRRDELVNYAKKYRNYLSKTIIIAGTDKKDKFDITRLSNGDVEVAVFRMKKTGEELQKVTVYSHDLTKEIWIYGLDDDDIFNVQGKHKSKIKIRLIGGLNKDTYAIENRSRIKIYDFKSQKNKIDSKHFGTVLLNDNYKLNQYDWKKAPINIFSMVPQAGYNPDDGAILGVQANYRINRFLQEPFGSKHSFGATFTTSTAGVNLTYKGIFPNLSNDWRFEIVARYSTPNFAQNFFGYGNETKNVVKDGSNYYRVRMQNIHLEPSYKMYSSGGVIFGFSSSFDYLKVHKTAERFIMQEYNLEPNLYSGQFYATPKINFDFENYNKPHNPTLGFGFHLEAGWKINLEEIKRDVPYLNSSLNFNLPLDQAGKLVFATMSKAKFIFTDNYEFFQGATLGGDSDLRGFRRERFLGDRSFLQSTDIRYNIGAIEKSFAPMEYGIFTGFDIGRVWLSGEHSKKWYTSYGAGIWLSLIESLTGQVAYFRSQDGGRITGGIGFKF